jgi:hypothetical protein
MRTRSPLPPWRAVLEVLFLGGAIPATLLWFSPARLLDTVLLTLVLWPLFLGLRFGFWAGALAAVQAAAVLAAIDLLQPREMAAFPSGQVIVVLLAGMVSGEARDTWVRKAEHLQELHLHHRTRLEQFASAYQLLQMSHAQLERRLADGAGSLRAALQRIQVRAREPDSMALGAPDTLAVWMLEVVAEVGNLHAAALYQVNERGVLQVPALASVGTPGALSPFDPMLRETLRSGALTSIHLLPEVPRAQALAMVPLVDASGRVHAVVAIFDMLFVSIHQRTFEALGVLGKHLGDILAARPVQVADRQGWDAFLARLERSHQLADSTVFPVALLACTVTDVARAPALLAHYGQDARGLDQCWTVANRLGLPVVLKIMPLTDEEGIARYLARLEREQPGSSFGMQTHHWMLDKRTSIAEVLQSLRTQCALEAWGPSAPTQRADATRSGP